MKTSSRLTLGLAATVLIIGVVGVVIGSLRRVDAEFTSSLAAVIPSAVDAPGWVVAPREVAETEELRRAVNGLLNFDEAVYVDYTKGEFRVSVYASYWAPGKMPHRLIAGHTPDVCWEEAGHVRSGGRREWRVPARAIGSCLWNTGFFNSAAARSTLYFVISSGESP